MLAIIRYTLVSVLGAAGICALLGGIHALVDWVAPHVSGEIAVGAVALIAGALGWVWVR